MGRQAERQIDIQTDRQSDKTRVNEPTSRSFHPSTNKQADK